MHASTKKTPAPKPFIHQYYRVLHFLKNISAAFITILFVSILSFLGVALSTAGKKMLIK